MSFLHAYPPPIKKIHLIILTVADLIHISLREKAAKGLFLDSLTRIGEV